MRKFVYSLLFFGICFLQVAIAQNKKASLKAANDLFEAGNYEAALTNFQQLLQDSPNDDKLNYKIGVCYLNSNFNKGKALPYLEKAATTSTDPNAYYLLGKAYHLTNRFDDAIKAYSKFKETGKGNPSNLKSVDHDLECCYNAKELIKFPVNVSFENLGKSVNSVYSDDFPFVPRNESFLIFNSRRDGNQQGLDGKYFSDVYMCLEKDGKWQQAKPLKGINTSEGDEEIIGLSADGSTAVFMFDNNKGSGDLYISKRNGETFSEAYKLPEVINSKYNEIAASLSADGNSIYFASDRPGGYGGIDLYISNLLPSGEWGPARNLGPEINTKYDEDFPSISMDGKTLLFSSKGHTSMGGYDIFKAVYNDETAQWGNVKNIGYPVNTSGDDMNLCLSENEKYGYMSSLREGGIGDLDLYRVVFNDIDPFYTIIRGMLQSSNQAKPLQNIMITVNRTDDGELFGTYLPNPQTMRYVIILPPGKYELVVEADGCVPINENIEILDKASFRPYIDKDITLQTK